MIEKEKLAGIRLVALDLDGTFLNEKSAVSEKNKEAVRKADAAGICVALSTGRPFCGILPDYMEGIPIKTAICTNGAAVYETAGKKCLFERCMDYEKVAKIAEFLITKHIHFDVFIDGDGYSDDRMVKVIDELAMPDELKYYLHGTRKMVPDIVSFIREFRHDVQKVTMNFPPAYYETDREEVRRFLMKNDALRVVSGGFMNLEFTDAAVSKAKALEFLWKHLGLTREETMAIGDSENDLDMIEAAGIGVAMGNARDEIKAKADLIAPDNIHDGVADVLMNCIKSR